MDNEQKKINRISVLAIIACLLNGWLAGGDIYRYIIEVPAWRHLDILEWAAYSRHADLGNGLFLFPGEAIGGFIPLVIASIIVLSNKNITPRIAWPVHIATLFALAGLVLTFFAAPIMLSLRTTGNDPEAIKNIFNRFHFFGLLRAIAQILSFCACIVILWKLQARQLQK